LHAATVEKSARLTRTLEILRAHPRGVTTAELQLWSGSMAPATDVSELRQSGYLVSCVCEGKNQNGRRVYRYTLNGRADLVYRGVPWIMDNKKEPE
jgi:hypothetical protein